MTKNKQSSITNHQIITNDQNTNNQSKRCLLIQLLVIGICLVIGNLVIGYSNLFSQEGVVNMKKVVMVIPEEDFRDEELLETKEILEKNGIEVKIASTTLKPVKGMLGARAKPDVLLGEVNIGDFDAVVFVGGIGASQYWNDATAHRLAQDAINTGRIIAAICIAPVTLAKAGVLKGRSATVFPSEAGELKREGANYTARPVERDGDIITASGPQAAGEFAEELVKAMRNK